LSLTTISLMPTTVTGGVSGASELTELDPAIARAYLPVQSHTLHSLHSLTTSGLCPLHPQKIHVGGAPGHGEHDGHFLPARRGPQPCR
jgi:hypothetical protein